MHIAFEDLRQTGWTAGGIYLSNVLSAIASVAHEHGVRVSGTMAAGTAADRSYWRDVDGVIAIPSDARRHSPTRRLIDFAARRVGRRVERRSPAGRLLRKAGVDALFSKVDHGPGFDVALLGWIPDFQHVYLPDLFSADERALRDDSYSRLARRAGAVVLSSQSAAADFARFAPAAAGRGRVVPFVSQIPADALAPDPAGVARQYHLPEKYFYLPNQFWVHKNHKLVIDAVANARARVPDLTVVCTGNLIDTRRPSHASDLLCDIARRDLRHNVLLLGLVPREHVVALARQSLAVLQPSLFEGWSSSIEEAKSLGKPVLASDIAVHREQDAPGARYFSPIDPANLAAALEDAWRDLPPGLDLAAERAAREITEARTREFGRRFIKAATDAVAAR